MSLLFRRMPYIVRPRHGVSKYRRAVPEPLRARAGEREAELKSLRLAVGGLLTAFAVLLAWPVRAVTPVTPLGIPVCDAFLTAYAQCANSPTVPESVRPGLRQAIGTTRESLRSSASASERARRTVEIQCAQNHRLIRERLMQAYGCDFPEPSAKATSLATQGRAPRP